MPQRQVFLLLLSGLVLVGLTLALVSVALGQLEPALGPGAFGLPAHAAFLAIRKNAIAARVDGNAPWRWLLHSTHIYSFAAAGDFRTLYAGTDSGWVWRSTDGGRYWHRADVGLPTSPFPYTAPSPLLWVFGVNAVASLAVDPTRPSIVYAISGPAGEQLYKTMNGGASWSRLTLDTLAARPLRTLAIDPHQPASLWLGTEDDGLYHSRDGGRTWAAVHGLPAKVWIDNIAVSPANNKVLFVALSLLHGPRDWYRLYRSTDGGQQWKRLVRGLPADLSPYNVVTCPQESQRLYLVAQGGVYLSTDGGQFWKESVGFPHTYIENLIADPHDSLVAYAYTGLGVLRTTDGGNTWHDWNSNVLQPDNTDVGRLVLTGPNS